MSTVEFDRTLCALMPYVPQSPDTSEAADRAMFAMLRAAGATRRFELARAHTQSAIRQARRRIAAEHPQWSEREVALHWAEIVYGKEVAEKTRAALHRKGML